MSAYGFPIRIPPLPAGTKLRAAIWLRLPGSDQWLLAEVFRSARKGAIARLMGGDAPEMRERRAANGGRAIAAPKENGTALVAPSRSK